MSESGASMLVSGQPGEGRSFIVGELCVGVIPGVTGWRRM